MASYPSRSTVRTCSTSHGPASMTVTGTTCPASSKSCVIPTLRPSIPIAIGVYLVVSCRTGAKGDAPTYPFDFQSFLLRNQFFCGIENDQRPSHNDQICQQPNWSLGFGHWLFSPTHSSP